MSTGKAVGAGFTFLGLTGGAALWAWRASMVATTVGAGYVGQKIGEGMERAEAAKTIAEAEAAAKAEIAAAAAEAKAEAARLAAAAAAKQEAWEAKVRAAEAAAAKADADRARAFQEALEARSAGGGHDTFLQNLEDIFWSPPALAITAITLVALGIFLRSKFKQWQHEKELKLRRA